MRSKRLIAKKISEQKNSDKRVTRSQSKSVIHTYNQTADDENVERFESNRKNPKFSNNSKSSFGKEIVSTSSSNSVNHIAEKPKKKSLALTQQNRNVDTEQMNSRNENTGIRMTRSQSFATAFLSSAPGHVGINRKEDLSNMHQSAKKPKAIHKKKKENVQVLQKISTFKDEEICFAHMTGYVPWPAKV